MKNLSLRGEGRLGGILFTLTLCGLVWRALLSFYLIPAWESSRNVARFPDDYPALARSLIETRTLGFGPLGGASPTTVRGLGFPLWLAAGMLVGGSGAGWLGFWSSLPVLILAPFAAAFAARRHGLLSAIGVGVILLFHPLPSLFSSRVMSDEFFAVCGFAAILTWDQALRCSRPRHASWLAFATGSLLAIQMLTRLSGLLFLIVVVILGLRQKRPRRALTGLVVAMALIPPLAWSLRSSRLEGRPVFVHSLAAYNFWIGEGFDRYGYGWTHPVTWPKVAGLLGSVGGFPADRFENFYYPELTPEQAATLDGRLAPAAAELVRSNPLGYAGRVIRGVWRFWLQAQSEQTMVLYAVAVFPLLGLGLAGVLRSFRSSTPLDRIVLASILLIVLHNLLYAGVLPMARFSIHVYPELAWLVGCALSTGRPTPFSAAAGASS